MPYPAFTGTRNWKQLTRMVNEIKQPLSFLTQLVFGGSDGETFGVENIQLDGVEDGRSMLPFVQRGAPPVTMRGDTETERTLRTPNISVQLVMRPEQLWSEMRAGYPQTVTDAQQRAAMADYRARQIASLMRKERNSMEFLASKVLQGPFTFALGDQTQFGPGLPMRSSYDVFTVTSGVTSTPVATTTRAWDYSGAGKITNIARDFRYVQRLGAGAHGRPATVAILGRNVTEHFLADAGVQAQLDNRRMELGQIAPRLPGGQGEMYIGRFANCDVWEYNNDMQIYDARIGVAGGVNNNISTTLLNDNHVLFLSPGPDSDFRWVYGPIYDKPQLEGASPKMQRLVKTYITEEPVTGFYVLKTRPLPVVTRPYTAHVFKPLVADAAA